MKNKVCVVTGGAGFIGSYIVEALLNEGAIVRIVDDLSTGKMSNIPDAVAFFKVDISLPQSATALEAIMQGADYVFHLAAMLSVSESIENPLRYHMVNVTGTQYVLEAARKTGVKRVILSSSAAVYGDTDKVPTTEKHITNPMSPYALHKRYAEQMCRLYSKIYNLNTVCLRYFNVYGPGHRYTGAYAPVVALFLKQYYDKVPLSICGDGKQTRDFVHVRDVAKANLKAATSQFLSRHEIINIGSGEETSVNRIAEMLACETTHLPARLEPKFSCADITKAKELLEWSPSIGIDEGVQEFIKYPKLMRK